MKYSKRNLIDRFDLAEVPRPNCYYRYGKFSVVNFGEVNKTHPFPEGLFSGWEALDDKGNITRAETPDDLLESLAPSQEVLQTNR